MLKGKKSYENSENVLVLEKERYIFYKYCLTAISASASAKIVFEYKVRKSAF